MVREGGGAACWMEVHGVIRLMRSCLLAGWLRSWGKFMKSCLLTRLQGRMEEDSEDLLGGWKTRDCGGGL